MMPDQCRAARARLRSSDADLARAAGVKRTRVARFEQGPRPQRATAQILAAVLERQGIKFPDGGAIVPPWTNVEKER